MGYGPSIGGWLVGGDNVLSKQVAITVLASGTVVQLSVTLCASKCNTQHSNINSLIENIAKGFNLAFCAYSSGTCRNEVAHLILAWPCLDMFRMSPPSHSLVDLHDCRVSIKNRVGINSRHSEIELELTLLW